MLDTVGQWTAETGDNVDPGPIEVGAGYTDWVGRFRYLKCVRQLALLMFH